MNLLLAGPDNEDACSVAQELADGSCNGSRRSDTLVVLHLTADRKHAYLVSIPRDAYVPVGGHGEQKINAVSSRGGPPWPCRPASSSPVCACSTPRSSTGSASATSRRR